MEVFKLHQEYAHSREKKENFSFCVFVSSELLRWAGVVLRTEIWNLDYKGKKKNFLLLVITIQPNIKEDKISVEDPAVNWCLETMI